jgi:hypothetical protein
VFLKVVISVVGGGLLYCTWMSTLCPVIIAAVTVTKLSQFLESWVQTLSLLIVSFIMIVFYFKFLLPKCSTG